MLDPMEFTEADVVRFLKHHPHFFEEHPNLLKKLHLKHDSGNAISLIERQNHILRKENTDLIDRLNQFINVAQRNDKLFMNLQVLVTELISCRSINEINQTLHTQLTERFDVDEVQVVLTHRLNTDGDLWLYCDRETLLNHFPAALKDRRNLCGEFDLDSRQLLFGDQNIKSVAIGALCKDEQGVGLIALGSKSASHFRSGTDTLFLGHLSKVVSQLLLTL
jgi:uncharacterized protein YigA (DUF484 family)